MHLFLLNTNPPEDIALSKADTCQDGAVAERLRRVRETLGLTQDEFSSRLLLSMTGYQNYENGKRKAPKELVIQMYLQFGVSPTWLLTGLPPVFVQHTTVDSSLSELLHLSGAPQDVVDFSHNGDGKEAIKAWLDDFWKTASVREKVWLEVQFEQSFPAFMQWLSRRGPSGG